MGANSDPKISWYEYEVSNPFNDPNNRIENDKVK